MENKNIVLLLFLIVFMTDAQAQKKPFITPQEYIYSITSSNNFKEYFADWSVHNTANFDYILTEKYEGVLEETGNYNSTRTDSLVLDLPRLIGDDDRSGYEHAIAVNVYEDAQNEVHKYTGLKGKKITVDFVESSSAKNFTLSLKFIPATLEQSNILVGTQNFNIKQQLDKIVFQVGSTTNYLDLNTSLSTISCNHLAITFGSDNVELYLNGNWVTLSRPDNVSDSKNDIEFGPYNGRAWEIKILNKPLDQNEVEQMSQRCVYSVEDTAPPIDTDTLYVSEDETYTYTIGPYPLCATYICLWPKQRLDGQIVDDLTEDKFRYYLTQTERAFEFYGIWAGMHDHNDWYGFLETRFGRDLPMFEEDLSLFVRDNTFSNPHHREDGVTNFWWHEFFHSYQEDVRLATGKREPKWVLEATASWGADFVYPGVHHDLLGYYTYFPHLPLYTIQVSPVDDYYGWEFKGGHQYGAGIFFSYITSFISDSFFLGRLFNEDDADRQALEVIKDLLAEDGHDLKEVFGDFAMRTTVWDYENGYGSWYRESELLSYNRMMNDKPEAESFNNKFTIDTTITSLVNSNDWTTIPEKLVPGSWAFNAYKLTDTEEDSYTITFKGENTNPNSTAFEARIAVKRDADTYIYYSIPISKSVAFGEQEASLTVATQAGDEIYVVVATAPDVYSGFEEHYRYKFKISSELDYKYKLFLLAGQSNMEGHATEKQLRTILCGRGLISEAELLNHGTEDNFRSCYGELDNQEDRLFHIITDFYRNPEGELDVDYNSVKARLEARIIDQNKWMDNRLINPNDFANVMQFQYRSQGGERLGPFLKSGKLIADFGFSEAHFGPELTLGHYLTQELSDNTILLKVVEGGTDLHVRWRSPSMEARLGIGDEPSNYPLLKEHLSEVLENPVEYIQDYNGGEIELTGFFWFQGFNDAINEEYAPEYEQNLLDFIQDLREDLNRPDLPVVIGKTNNDGKPYGVMVQQAQEYVANNVGNARSVTTNDLSSYFHFDSGSHLIIGQRMGEQMINILIDNIDTPTSTESTGVGRPTEVALAQNYPNPFNPVTTINYQINVQTRVRLEVFDIMGRSVASLVNRESQFPGTYTVHFDASGLTSGVYVYRLQVGTMVFTRKMTLIK